MAEETDMGGVITPSAKRVLPPIIAGMTSHFAFLRTRVYKAKIPPSPLLSACKVNITYFKVVCRVIVQNRSEEHTSELQSRENLVCRLLLEKKKKNTLPQPTNR